MNSRQRIMTMILATVLGGGAIIFGVMFWFKTPLDNYNATIASLTAENQKKQEEFDAFQMQRKKLVLARAKSLPPNAAEATNEYQRYLQHVMTYNGLAVEDITPSQASKMKFQPTIPGIRDVGHQMMTYTVRARGELKSLVAAMELMQTTPYEHRIRNLTVNRPDMVRDSKEPNPKLHIEMVVETLLVAKSNAKTGLPPGYEAKYVILDSLAAQGGVPSGWGMLGSLVAIKTSMPVPEYRNYKEIALRNIFTGPIAKIETITPPYVKQVEPEPTPVGPYTPKYVYLTHTDPEQQTAYWKNRVFRSLEQKLVAKPNSGYQHFKIADEPGDFIYLKAKVIRVDLRVVFFQKEKSIYAWHIGTSLEEALENSLDIDQRDALDLEIDQVYATESTADPKTKTTSKKSGPKGATKGPSRGGQ